MDISRLFDGIVLMVIVILAARLLGQVDAWRSTVFALHLRWEREQRQAAPNGVTLLQRQAVQTQFEQLVANRPMRLWWTHLVLGIASIGFVLLLAWRADDLRWVGLWLAIPLGLTIASMLGYGGLLVNQANTKLTATSSTLYGPAPPRVKVRAIQTVEPENPPT